VAPSRCTILPRTERNKEPAIGSTFSGELFYVVLIAIVDAAILSWAALRWYQHAVSRRMRPTRGAEFESPRVDAPEPIEPLVGPPAADESLHVAVYHARGVSNRRSGRREWSPGWRRTGSAYCVGAALFSAVITAAAAAEMPSVTANALFGMWWMHTWPIVPTLILLLLLDRWSGLRLAAGYVMCGSAALALLTLGLQFWRGSFNGAPLTNMFWLNVGLAATAWLPLLLVVGSGWHRIRAVMPLALASTLFFGFGLLLFRAAIVRGFNAPATREVLLEVAVLTSTQTAYYSLYMLFALPAGWLAWRALKALATAFERKKFSDIQLVIDCWWLIVTAERIATHLVIPFGPAGIGIGLAAFAAYRAGTFTALSLVPHAAPDNPKRLLLLRVFGQQSRSESLFDRIAQRWRFRGPVQLIAGADLVMRTADPGDMLTFVGGRLRDVYVSKPSEISVRLARLDMCRDPDGRFRVNDLYCANETWQATLLELLKVTDTVVMDVRGFSDANAGCVFELQQLLRHLPAEAIVLVCDTTTDLTALAALLRVGWRAGVSPRTVSAGLISLVRVDRNSPSELDTLEERLLGRGTPQRVLRLADLPTLA
jgi:hypothetical protein